jgi:O-acetylserine/cysteine efflux transporter
MNTDRRRAVAALTAAGLAWGTTVPLSKLAMQWLAPGWLTFARFGLAAAVLLLAASRPGLRAAWTPSVLASGAAGYGGSVVVQNIGITRTSVTHAALLIGAVPVLVAIIAALWHRTVARPAAWAGFALSLAGVGLITGGRGGGATAGGDCLVLASLLLSATFTVAQGRLLRGRDPVAVTAVQFLGAALAVLPFSLTTEGMPAASGGTGAVLAAAGLAVGGTLVPFTLFAYGQSRVAPEVAGAFVNLEPLVGAAAGVVIFGDPAGPVQVAGGAAIIAGIVLSSLPLLRASRRQPRHSPGGTTAPRPPAAQEQARTTSFNADGHREFYPLDERLALIAGAPSANATADRAQPPRTAPGGPAALRGGAARGRRRAAPRPRTGAVARANGKERKTHPVSIPDQAGHGSA